MIQKFKIYLFAIIFKFLKIETRFWKENFYNNIFWVFIEFYNKSLWPAKIFYLFFGPLLKKFAHHWPRRNYPDAWVGPKVVRDVYKRLNMWLDRKSEPKFSNLPAFSMVTTLTQLNLKVTEILKPCSHSIMLAPSSAWLNPAVF